ncbi:TetR/AcrR family transcriptional regulator [Mycolicibacterium tusciae]|jgi:AcrR family transcriptional regulator|uniref:TetR/AcrR family transcriptional regulator n=1 Tax=Mycolicibacterium tusciae TaxID=75922 RepID=UPI00024A473C|nr:TetR/AcrR family transcriptional regulator [Mycolicibacterium tusciae]
MNDPPMGTTKREAVLDAALELFEERTFYGTAMPLVAARAGVGAGTIYRHFESKEVLANELFRFWKGELAAALAPAAAAPSAVAGFGLYWDGLTDFTLAHPTAFAFLETHRHQPYLDADSRAIALALDSQIERFIRRHQRTGDLRSGDPAELIALVLGAFVGLVRAAGDGRIRLTRRRLRAAAPRVWHLIGPPMR